MPAGLRERSVPTIVLKLARGIPREVKRLINGALIVGVGTIQAEEERGDLDECLLFNQGLQQFFVRKILERRYPSLMRMLGTAAYKDYLRLPTDRDLWSLMMVPFSPKLADYAREAAQAYVPTEQSAAFGEAEAKAAAEAFVASEGTRRIGEVFGEAMPEAASQDEQIIREAIARELNEEPHRVTQADYRRVKRLDLSYSSISDVTPLSGLVNLQNLNLIETQIRDVTVLSALTRLQKLDLSSTPVNDEQVAELKKALPDLEIFTR